MKNFASVLGDVTRISNFPRKLSPTVYRGFWWIWNRKMAVGQVAKPSQPKPNLWERIKTVDLGDKTVDLGDSCHCQTHEISRGTLTHSVMGVRYNLIVARCKNNGIGYKGQLPWCLRKEFQYFSRMTKAVSDPRKKNVVLMGRKTWDSLPEKMKPLPDRLNFVLSTQPIITEGAVLCRSFDEFIEKMKSPDYSEGVETAWIIGGTQIYEEALRRNVWDRLYLTEILKEFECDTFLNVDVSVGFKEVSDERVPKGIQEENGIEYIYHVYEKVA